MEYCYEKPKITNWATLSKHSIQRDLGTHHLATLDKLEKIIYTLQPTTVDLRLIPEYQVLFPDLCFPNLQ